MAPPFHVAILCCLQELIPEFFYLPEFLCNINRLHLGVKQSTGMRLHHVGLPPWCHGSPDLFVKIHRDALECDFVSSQLHNWIDLVFGCKQRGQAAVDAHNGFFFARMCFLTVA